VRTVRFTAVEHAAAAAGIAAEVVAGGGVVLLPTETFYGLGADPWQPDATARVAAMKGRPPELALSVLCADWAQLEGLVEVPAPHRVRLSRIWPGALSAVMRCPHDLAAARNATLAVRIPGHAMIRAVLYRTGPLTGTSANRHGEPACVEAAAAVASLMELPDLVLDGGPTAGGQASTVVDLTSDEAQVLRLGAVVWDPPYPWDDDRVQA